MVSLKPARVLYAASVLATVCYGIYLVLAGISLHFLLRHRRHRFRQYFFIGYLLIIFLLSTINFGFMTKYNDDILIEQGIQVDSFRDFRVKQFSTNEDICIVIIVWLADALLTYRAYVVWGGNIYIAVLPAIMVLADIACGTCLLVSRINSWDGIEFDTPFWSLSVSFNVLMTLLISGRLFWYHWTLKTAGGSSYAEHSIYPSLIATFMESAACYSVCGLIYISLLAQDSPLQYIFAVMVRNSAFIAPNLIILRVALGTAVTEETTRPVAFKAEAKGRANFAVTTTPHDGDSTTSHSDDSLTFTGYPFEPKL